MKVRTSAKFSRGPPSCLYNHSKGDFSFVFLLYMYRESSSVHRKDRNCSFQIEADESILLFFVFQISIKLRSIDGALTFIMLFRALTVTSVGFFCLYFYKSQQTVVHICVTNAYISLCPAMRKIKTKKVKEVYVLYLPLTKERNIKKKFINSSV